MHVGFLLFPKVEQLDLTAPHQVFALLADTEVHLVARTREPVASATGLILTPTTTFADCPRLDVLCVPGGFGVNALMEDPETLAFVRDQAATARFVTSVCTGTLVLAAAGLLTGRRATTHWAALDLLAPFGITPVQARVVRDGRFVTGGGVTAGLDFALTLVGEIAGRTAAEAIQLHLEYAPAPPFQAGSPDQAPPEVVKSVRERLAATRRQREQIVERLTAARGG